MAGMLDRWAQRRYARSFKNVLATQNDTRGLAVYLRDALPSLVFDDLVKLGYASSVFPSIECDNGVNVPLTPYDEMRDAAAKLAGMEFWYHAPHVEGERGKTFTITIVENPPTSTELTSIEVPDFLAEPTVESSDDGSAEDEPSPLEVDCHE